MTEIIKLQNVGKHYQMGDNIVKALDGVDIEIERGNFVAIMGPSGSGKSTGMNLTGSLDLPTYGKIFLDGQDISHLTESEIAQVRGKKIGFIFQSFNLIPNLTAKENIMLPMIFQGKSKQERERKAEELLKEVDLTDRADHYPNQLSVGKEEYIIVKERDLIKPMKIGEFVDNIIKNTNNVEKLQNIKDGIRVKITDPIEIATFDDDYKQGFTKLSQVIRHKTDSIYEVKTEYGFKINCTGAHSIFLYKNGIILPKRVSDLKCGETIPIALKIPNSNLKIKNVYLAEEIKNLSLGHGVIIKNGKIRYKISHEKDSINTRIKIDKKLCRILGDFSSEGCVRHDTKKMRYYITFTLGIKEIKRAELIIKYFEAVFGLMCLMTYPLHFLI